MPQDAMQIKERIISLIRMRGPSLPVHVSKETGLSILFASAFLSELFNDKRLMMSNLRVGSSPLYFLPEQEPQLEKFSQYLKSREKDAFLKLKEFKFLKDSEQEPAIRVALREIKDFAMPFKAEEDIYWRYFLVPQEEFRVPKRQILEQAEQKTEDVKKIENIFEKEAEKIAEEEIEKEEELIEEKVQERQNKEQITPDHKKEKPRKKIEHKKIKQNKNKKSEENFFNKIKENLAKKDIEILDILDFKNNEAILKVKKDKKEELFFIFNTKKITEKEILKAHKKAAEFEMNYSILFAGEVPKKMSDLITAIKGLSNIDKIE